MNNTKNIFFGRVAEAEAWRRRHPWLASSLAFLARADLAALADGRHELGDGAFAMVQSCELKAASGGTLHAEVHSRYIDVQMPLSGAESFGVREIPARFEPFDADRDCGFGDIGMEVVTLNPGEFAVFMPEFGAHAPCVSPSGRPVAGHRKVVVKIPAALS